MELREHVPLAPLTTFKIGGSARILVAVRTERGIQEALAVAKERKLPWVILAGGSNVLVPDEGLEALVIHIVEGEYRFDGDTLEADAGCNLFELIKKAAERNLGGWEKLAGIPGTIGGAVRGNAGAFGSEIKHVAARVRALNARSGEMREFSNDECDFSYRHSFFKVNPEWIVTRVAVTLVLAARTESERLVEETIHERQKRHLQDVRAAGSFFMNPVVPRGVQELFERDKGMSARGNRVPAGWLIEKAGMKGATVGGAIASLQHPNYLVNKDGATAEDVKKLAEQIKDAVWSKFAVALQEEAALL